MSLTCLVAAPSAYAVGPTNTSQPTISGAVQAGHTLQGHPGEWQSLTTPSYTYRWCRVAGLDCTTLASGPVYTLTAADIGSRIKLVVTASDAVGSTDKDSAPTAPVAEDPPDNTAAPTFSGDAEQGKALTCISYGSWSDPTPTGYARQWLRCSATGVSCAPIAGASGDSYTLAGPDVGATIRLRVRAAGPYGAGEALSGPSAVVGGPSAPDTPKEHRRARRLSPFPRILVQGALSPNGALFRQVVVKGPRHVTVRVRCRGGGCPYRTRSYRMRRRKLRLRSLERNFRSGTVILFRVVKKGRVGKYTRIRIRRGRVPSRVDRCLNPGSSRPKRCK